ncbi:cell wall-binding protein [Streptococcus parasanguinis]|uniref:cell wall-binding protein n=1 Tax=Streptococcus parasanguinis TaxID=1318 RepID=UPI0018976861|nr:cell wall-binding protein [Streptococcus parasanguinis]
MKKITKLLLGGALVILLLALPSQVKADWHQDNIGWWYSTNNGSYYKDTLAYIDNNIYRFDERGYMITGWYLEEYRDTSGSLLKDWSYFDPVSGARLGEGWQQIDGKWYYLYSNSIARGKGFIDEKNYYFDPVNGDMKTGWISTPGLNGTNWSYYDPVSGAALKGWQQIDGKWYYFLDYSTHNYALKGFTNIGGKEYYFDPVNADMKTGWISRQSDVKKWYYYDPESGERLLGWKDIDGKKYYLTSEGAYCGHTYTIDGKLYYFDPVTCELITGWFEYNGRKRYGDPNDGGALALNKTLIIDGVSYSFSDSGALITNEP